MFDTLETGKGCRISIIGEAGIGKSRLVADARQQATDEVMWLECRALSYPAGISYYMARDLLYRLIGTYADNSQQEIEAALRSTIERLFGEGKADIYPYLARLLDLPLDETTQERVHYLSAEALRSRMQGAYLDYVRARAHEKPLILIWEDLHWADPSTLALLQKLMALADEAPILFLMAFRPEDEQTGQFHQQMQADYGSRYSVIELKPLPRDESARLLNNLLNVENMPAHVQRLILDKAEGNAFFLEEVLRSLMDAGLVLLEGERARASNSLQNLKSLDVPDTLQGVIAARIDRLPPSEKQTLQNASVIGRVFQQRVLAHLIQQDIPDVQLDASLNQLQQREFIRLRAELEYIFKHAVTHDVAYNSLLLARRKELHRVTAESIEALFSSNSDDLAATLAYHYQQAEEQEKALHYLTLAADQAKATYANAEAIAFYEAALGRWRRQMRGALTFWKN